MQSRNSVFEKSPTDLYKSPADLSPKRQVQTL